MICPDLSDLLKQILINLIVEKTVSVHYNINKFKKGVRILNTIKKATCLFLTIFLVFSLSACQKGYKGAYIYFELLEPPATIDAQTAFSDSELLIVRNIYEGLLRKSDSGSIVCGVCESYEINGLEYKFEIRKDAMWSNGEDVTAYDFVFAFRRAVQKSTGAPFASRLFCIKNAQEIYSGRADVSTLGITAVDEKNLTITLSFEDPDFEEALTTSVCMPCNEEFFNSCEGKYGLAKEYIISNGSYHLTKWNREDFGIRLYRNPKYSSLFKSQNAAVFISCDDESTQVERLLNGSDDMAFLPSSEINSADSEKLTSQSAENICWVMTVGDSYTENVKSALLSALSPGIKGEALPAGFSAAESIYPGILETDCNGLSMPEYNLDSAKARFSAAVKAMENNSFSQATLYYYDVPGARELATAIAGHWQQQLGAYVNIQSSSSLTALQSELSSRSLSFALFPVTSYSTSVPEYLTSFGIHSQSAGQAQTNLLANKNLVPIAFQSTYIAYNASLQNVLAEPFNGYIDFSFIIKK